MSYISSFLKAVTLYVGKGGTRATLLDYLLSGMLKTTKPRGKVAMDNLSIAFPQSTEEWRKDMLSKVYSHFASTLVEYIVALNEPDRLTGWFKTVEGKKYLDEALTSGRGAVLLFGHLGNWELLGGWLALSGYPVYAMVRKHDDQELEDLIDGYRQRMNLKIIDKDNIREPIRQLKKGNFVAIAGDQHWGRAGLEVPFLGKICSTPSGPAVYAILTGAPIIPIAAFRRGKFDYVFEAYPPIEPQRKGDSKQETYRLTMLANQAIEKMIRRAPEQWLWMHRRWR